MRKLNIKKLFASSVLAIALVCAPNLSANAAQVTEKAEKTQKAVSAEDSRIALPSGSQRTDLVVNGRSVLSGRVFTLSGVTYVPMIKFASWLGVFNQSNYVSNGIRKSSITGKNLKIEAVENNLYISANDRYFYTVGEILEIGGELYVPIYPLVKALNCYVTYNSATGAYNVRSGDTSRLPASSKIYREDEVYWLARIISAEARGESFKGKIAVGNVILNRVRSNLFPNTIYSVIFDRKYGVQFSPILNGSIYQTPTKESIIAAKVCLEGYSLSNETLYFVNPKAAPDSWISKNRVHSFTVGNHAFYK